MNLEDWAVSRAVAQKSPQSGPTAKKAEGQRKSSRISLVGRRFGRLVVESYSHSKKTPKGKKNRAYWLCRCDCGNSKITMTAYLTTGSTSSCGCLSRERVDRFGKHKYSHGHTCFGKTSSTYHRWAKMVQRCHNPKDFSYPNYGGRGIQVCEEWKKFENFLKDMGEAPSGLVLDRIDNNKGYCKENCRWTDTYTSSRNRRNAVMITHDGQTMTAAE